LIFIGRYKEAITHTSFVFEQKKGQKEPDNERLEFLGDSVLQLCVSHLLCRQFPEFSEGQMTRVRHQLVDNPTLAVLSRNLNLGEVLRIGRGEERAGGRTRERMLSNVFEALLGAVYLELGIEACQEIIDFHFKSLAQKIAHHVPAKQVLMEWSQKTYAGKVPEYRFLRQEGKSHELNFVFGVLVNGELIAEGEGLSKKAAQIVAAEKAVGILTDIMNRI
jgi:ribonuclease-3